MENGVCQVVPFWAERAWDARNGGFFEALDMSGRGLNGIPRRVRAQARQSYVFARCTLAGWVNETEQAVEGLERLKAHAWQAGGMGGWSHLLDDQGQVIDARRDLYDHAFIILACAWVFKASGDSTYRDLAFETLDFVETKMASEQGGFIEGIGAPLQPRRQNPHMHLLEALMALYETTDDPDLLPRIAGLRNLFDGTFYQSDCGQLLEFFTDDWLPHPQQGHVLEPGHFCEWVWLLAECERLTGWSAGEAGAALFANAMARGRNSRTGLLYTSMDTSGQPIDAGSRTWMQTEWVRAASVELKRGNPLAAELLELSCEGLLKHHLGPAVAGGWADAIDSEGMSRSANMPGSTLYHLVGSLIELAGLHSTDMSGEVSCGPVGAEEKPTSTV